MYFGKIFGGIIGFFVIGPLFGSRFFGLSIGLLVGHYFDRRRARSAQRFSPEQQFATQNAFFNGIFPVLGHLAKADGRVSEEEIAGTQALMARMGLDDVARKEAIRLFKTGLQSDFDLQANIATFMSVCGQYNDLKQVYLVNLITLALADDHLHENEESMLRLVAEQLGYSSFTFNHLLGMVKAQLHFYRRHGKASSGGTSSHADELTVAYTALGVEANTSDGDIKKAYRKLMSEYHPDKLAGRGVPQDMIKVATERSQEIQSAYEIIKKSRKGA